MSTPASPTPPSDGRADPASTYPWPCTLRTAHGPHDVREDVTCPGVRAHPATMIGRPARTPEE